jgi:tetratricopeptide (TPR) repeat protein
MTIEQQSTSSWRRSLAHAWYAWGSSLCYWGVQTAEPWFFRAAVRSFDRVVRVWPQFALGWYRRGLVRSRELGQHAAGIADLSQAIALEPEWAEAYLQRGLIQRFHGDRHAAIDDLRRFLALGGDVYWRMEAERQIAALEAEHHGSGEQGSR